MRICILSGVNILFNPRTFREANALAEEGHDVRVIDVKASPEWDQAIERLLARWKWRYQTVNYKLNFKGHVRWLTSQINTKIYRHLVRFSLEGGIAEQAFCRFGNGQLERALEEPTDLYIAHKPSQLPVAAMAAQANGAIYGFDMEDYHLDEHTPGQVNLVEKSLKRYLMAKYVPHCSFLSTTTERMADAIVDALGVRRPTVLHNVSPLYQASSILSPEMRGASQGMLGQPLTYTAYWVSWTIGLDRGLQDFIHAMPRLSKKVTLHLRGGVIEGAKRELMHLATKIGVSNQIFFYDTIHPEDVAKDAARFDFGLALEQPINQNKRVNTTYKMFTYLLAGIVPVVTDLPSQRDVMEQIKGGGVLYKPGDIDELVEKMNHLLTHPEQIMQAKKQAWESARSKFCWDIEKQKLISALRDVEKTRSHCR